MGGVSSVVLIENEYHEGEIFHLFILLEVIMVCGDKATEDFNKP